MKSKFDALVKDKTWILFSPPNDRKIIDNKWAFRVKELADGQLDKLKARVVAKGCLQVTGFDFFFKPSIQ